MAHTNSFSTTAPLDDSQLGKGAEAMRKAKLDIKERMAVDHVMENNLDPAVAGGDGQHNKVTLVNKATDPTLITGTAVLYAKSDGLYFRNSSGIVKII